MGKKYDVEFSVIIKVFCFHFDSLEYAVNIQITENFSRLFLIQCESTESGCMKLLENWHVYNLQKNPSFHFYLSIP